MLLTNLMVMVCLTATTQVKVWSLPEKDAPYRSNAYEAQLLATLDSEPVNDQQIEVELDEATLDQALEQALAELPPSLHQIFSLHYQEELTIPQIAEIVDIPEGTVKSRLHKTMNIIRKKLKKYEDK